ncbi:MAG: hypothetical protein NVSMB66_6980 [Candidatus Doudnabacteria bacterium]
MKEPEVKPQSEQSQPDLSPDQKFRELFDSQQVFITPEKIKKDVNRRIEERIFDEEQGKSRDVNGRLTDREVSLGTTEADHMEKADAAPVGADLISKIVDGGDDPSSLKDLPPHEVMNSLLKFLDEQK